MLLNVFHLPIFILGQFQIVCILYCEAEGLKELKGLSCIMLIPLKGFEFIWQPFTPDYLD